MSAPISPDVALTLIRHRVEMLRADINAVFLAALAGIADDLEMVSRQLEASDPRGICPDCNGSGNGSTFDGVDLGICPRCEGDGLDPNDGSK